MAIRIYLNEFKLRLNYFLLTWLTNGFVFYYYSKEILELLLNPLNVYGEVNRIVFMSLDEGFFGYIKVYLFISFLLSLPSLFFQVLFFILPGLYRFEVNNILKFFSLTCLLSFLILFFIYFYLVPHIWHFFSSFQFEMTSNFSLDFEPKFNSYLSFIFNLFTVSIFLIVFIFVLILLILFEFISLNILLLNRKYIFFAFLLLSTLISPPDIISQVFLTILLSLLFEAILFIVLIIKF